MITCILSYATWANAGPDPAVSLKGGLSAATQDAEYRAHRYGFSGGLGGYLLWQLDPRFSLGGQLDLLYTSRGADVVDNGERQATFNEPYFDVALAARPGMRLGRTEVYLLLGGSLNLLLSASKENVTGSSQNLTNDFHRVDVALAVGAGVALHLSDRGSGPFRLGSLFLEARHDHGLLDVDAVNGGLKNRTSSIMFGLSFALGALPDQMAPSPVLSNPAPPATVTSPVK